MDKVSIIVPIYNSEKYLKPCIQSIINQTYTNIEILLIDDGSLDSSLKICYEFEKNNSKIKVCELKHSGVSAARNFGIENSTGKYLCFIDSDDIIDNMFIETLINLVQKYNADIGEANFGFLDKKHKKTKIKENTYTPKEMAYRLYSKEGIKTGLITNKIYKKDIFKNLRFENNIVNEDDFIIHKIFFETKKKIATTNQKLYWYRQHKESRQQSFSKERLEFLNVFKDRKKYFINDKKLLEKNEIAEIDMILYLYHLCKIHNLEKEKHLLKLRFNEKYKKLNIKISLKKRIKYYLFNKNPNLVANIIFLKQRKFYVK